MQQQLFELVTQQFGLQVIEQRLPLVTPEPVQAKRLFARLARNTDLIVADTNERTRAETIVAPIMIHLAVTHQLSLYSGTAFNADIKSGLSGTVDYVFSRAMPQRSRIEPPITAVVETKSRKRGVSHCLVQMVATQRMNADFSPVYGTVTTGFSWRFLKLERTIVTIDLTEHLIFSSNPLISSLMPMAQTDHPSSQIEPLLSLLVLMIRQR